MLQLIINNVVFDSNVKKKEEESMVVQESLREKCK